MQLIQETFAYFSENKLELVATIFGFACVALNVAKNIWAWPTGIVSVSIYIYIFFNATFYGDAGLSAFYVVSGFYGWYNWLYGGQNSAELPVNEGSSKEKAILLASAIIGTAGLGYALAHTDDSFPYWDAATTVVSLIAQWQLTQKRLENWLLWIFVDIICIFVYYAKDLYITSFLYAAYLLLAILGYFSWKRTLVQSKTALPR